MSTHALFAPSAAHRWMRCPGSLALGQGRRDESSEHADEGTAAHELAADCLRTQEPAAKHVGRVIVAGRREFVVDDEMAAHVQTYLDSIWDHALGGQLLIEERVEFGARIGLLEDQHGTSDAIVIQDDELQVHDLKFGRGVQVDAEHNEQLMLYALGALDLVELLGYEIERVRLVIHQPRLGHLSAWDCSVQDLLAFAERAKQAAEHALAALHTRGQCVAWPNAEQEAAGLLPSDWEKATLHPGDKQCRWCPAKATCPALRDAVLEPVFGGAPATPDEFDDATVPASKHIEPTTDEWLAAAMTKIDLIEVWCKAVRAEVESRLLAGRPIAGWKLVEGRRGARKWASTVEAEAALKAMRLKHDQMYDYAVISPTQAEKLAKAEVIGPRQWPKLQALITQTDGKPSVAPETDKRPALVVTPTADEFEDESAASLV